jgi:probable biosynthetic protein (TIGR04098 family)
VLTSIFELDLANAGLAGLDEVSFLRLFATTQAHALVRGTGHTLRDITNADGVPLYPAFYRTRVTVPPPLLFARHRVWERVEMGVELHRYGRMLLESRGVIGIPGELPDGTSGSSLDRHIRIAGSMAFIHDADAGEQRVDSPREGAIAELPSLPSRPEALDEQRRIRAEGLILPPTQRPSNLSGRVRLPLLVTRDVQAGRALMFASFTTLFEVAEQTLLLEQIWPAIDPALLSFRHLLDRDVHYIGNLRQGDAVTIETTATLSPCPKDLASGYEGLVGVALLELRSELYQEASHALIAAAVTRKLFAVPKTHGSAVQDMQRMLLRHGGAGAPVPR